MSRFNQNVLDNQSLFLEVRYENDPIAKTKIRNHLARHYDCKDYRGALSTFIDCFPTIVGMWCLRAFETLTSGDPDCLKKQEAAAKLLVDFYSIYGTFCEYTTASVEMSTDSLMTDVGYRINPDVILTLWKDDRKISFKFTLDHFIHDGLLTIVHDNNVSFGVQTQNVGSFIYGLFHLDGAITPVNFD